MARLKICGLTNAPDLRLADELGADYVGFNFSRTSPRFIEPERAAYLIRSRPLGARRVGVFVNEAIGTVRRVFEECRLDVAQLHGDESPDYCRELGLPYWKAVRVREPEAALREIGRHRDAVVLLDARVDGRYGGTGISFDPEIARRAISDGTKIVIAGGIGPDNLERTAALCPFAVDVCSSLEKYPGKKCEETMKRFFEIWKRLSRKLDRGQET